MAEFDNELLLLVDTSFNSFFRFFATKRWYSLAFKEDYAKISDFENYDWVNNKDFMEKYEKMYLSFLKKIIDKKKNYVIIFVQDPPQKDIWRNKEIENYKGKRKNIVKDYNIKPVFTYTYNKIIPKLVKSNKNIFTIKEKEIEADDIIISGTK